MEHMSRLTTNNINLLFVVSDATRRGIQAASRIIEIAGELQLKIDRTVMIVNQAREDQVQGILNAVQDRHLELNGIIPEDPQIREFDLAGRPTAELGRESIAFSAATEIFERILHH